MSFLFKVTHVLDWVITTANHQIAEADRIEMTATQFRSLADKMAPLLAASFHEQLIEPVEADMIFGVIADRLEELSQTKGDMAFAKMLREMAGGAQ